MKKKILSALFATLLCVSLPISVLASPAVPSGERLYDGADLLTDSEEATLLTKLNTISNTYGVEIVIATVESTEGYSTDSYVEYYYDSGDYGFGENRDGVLLLVDMGGREYRILSNGIGASAITTDDIDTIGEDISPYLSDGDYAYAFEFFADDCEFYINGYINGFPYNFPVGIVVSLVVGFVIALIVTGIMRAQLKSVRPQDTATFYTRDGSMVITGSNDLYLYRNVTRTKIQTNSSSGGGGGGGSRNVGGGKF